MIDQTARINPAGNADNRMQHVEEDARPRIIRSQRPASPSFSGWGPRL